MYEINHFRILILSAPAFTEEKEKIAVMIKISVIKLVHRKKMKAEAFKSYADFWKLGGICLWQAKVM